MTACHRILLPRCAAAALADHKPLTHALNRLTDDGSLVRYERLLPGGLTVYTLSPSTAAHLGLPRERAELPTAAALDTAIAVQVFCHLGRRARFRLTVDEVDDIFPKTPNNVPFLISGELGSVAIFRAVLIADRAPAEAIRYLRTLIEQAERNKTLASELTDRQLGFALLASTPQQVAALEKSLNRSGLLQRAAVIIDVGPDAEHLAPTLKAKSAGGEPMNAPLVELGKDVLTGRSVSLPLALFERHGWIQGMTGARKTIIATKICTQLMRHVPQAAFVICDLGGDQYFFNQTRELAKQLGKSFQFLSVNREDDWDALDPMAAITPLQDLSVSVSYLHTILGGDHGEGYGAGYFGRYSYVSIQRILMGFVAEGLHSPTLHDFAKRFASSKGKLSDQSEAQLAAEMMLSYDQVQPSAWGHKQIDVPTAVERAQVTYGFLPTLMHPGARMLASTLVFSFVLEAMRRHYVGLPVRPIFLVIDEFPSVAQSKQWSDLITLARKYHIRILCLTQTSEQMKSRDRDLLPVLFDNTAIKIWLTPTSQDDIETLRNLSKDQLKQRGVTQGFRAGVSSVSMGEVYEPRLEANEIRDVAYAGDQGFLIVNAFQGHSEPIRFRFTPDTSPEEYARLATLPLPKREPAEQRLPVDVADPNRVKRKALLDQLLATKHAQLQWEQLP